MLGTESTTRSAPTVVKHRQGVSFSCEHLLRRPTTLERDVKACRMDSSFGLHSMMRINKDRRGGFFGATAVLVFLFGFLAILGDVAEAALLFNPTNVAQLSLYQTAQLRFTSNVLDGDPTIVVGSAFYFAPDDGTACVSTGSGAAANSFTISAADSGGFTGRATIAARADVFTAGRSYIICYIKDGSAYMMRRGAGAAGESGALLVWPALYGTSSLSPAIPSGGEGPVDLTVQQTAQTGRPTNAGFGGSSTIFMLPCASGQADCGGLNVLPLSCANAVVTPLTGVIQLNNLRGVGTTSVTGSFTIPFTPTTYAICVPYCYSSSAGCGTGSVEMSYTVVLLAPSPSTNHIISFTAANPGSYTVTPSAPQAREDGFMIFTGEDLSAADQVRVIREGDRCTSSTATLLENLQLGSVTLVSSTSVNVTIRAPNLITAQMRGRVCYKRASTGLWASVYKSADSQLADFTIDILQPSSFTLSPRSPTIGTPFTVTFTGTGIDSTTDSAFLTSTSGANACTSSTENSTFSCELTRGSTPTCTVIADPATNSGLTLQVCYRKANRVSFSRLSGTVAAGSRNPIYITSPYPLYAGQLASMVFSGTGLASTDKIQFVIANGICGTATPVTTVTIAAVTEVVAGQQYSYNLLGQANQCLQVCYQFTGSSTWTVARPQQLTSVTSDCAAQDLYISAYALRYTLPNAGSVTAQETLSIQLSSTGGMPASLKLVRSTDNCVFTFCNGMSACQLDLNAVDFVSNVGASSATLLLGNGATSYILCASNGETGFIPVLRSGSADSDTTFAFQSGAANPTLGGHSPDVWRVAYAELGTTYKGTDLNSTTDTLLAIRQVALISTNPPVCPMPSTSPSLALTSTLTSTSSTTEISATHARSDGLFAGAVVYMCYVWGSGRVTYTGSVTLSERLPSQMTLPETPTGVNRAGQPITLTFISNTSDLQPSTDAVFFYRFAITASGWSTCYCGGNCPSGARVSYDVPFAAQSATSLTWTSPRGFDNYAYNAIYITCYSVTAVNTPTFLGRLIISMANPTYYTVSNGNGNRVGLPMTIQALRQCTDTTCAALNVADTMRLIPSTTECYQLTDTTIENEADAIQAATVTGSSTFTQRFVVDVAGNYRVCYRLKGVTTPFQELPYSTSFTLNPITVAGADPSNFVTTPVEPSSGQYLNVQLTCSASACSSCTLVRIVPGAKATCWANVDNSYSSENCLTTSSAEFPNKYLPAGDYTVCYGDDMTTSQRVPGTLTVLQANPSTFTTSTVEIFTNQDSDVTLTITGSSLSTSDTPFLLTSIGYTCHDLRKNELQENGTLQNWFAPSITPNPLTVSADGKSATWIVSNRDKRFGGGILSDATLCTTPGESCTMQLCYMRNGGTWAPVSIQSEPNIELLPSDPESVVFDRFPLYVGIYTMATVVGRHLQTADVISVHDGNCAGDVITTSVGTATVNTDGTQWIGVVRITAQPSSSSSTGQVSVCYKRASTSTTEIGNVNVGGQTSVTVIGTSHYVYNTQVIAASHEMTRFELINVGITFGSLPASNVLSMSLITGNTECNYLPYYASAGIAPEFEVVMNLSSQSTSYFIGRLTAPVGTYALCANLADGLFRLATRQRGGTLTIGAANPSAYTPTPSVPFPDQLFSVQFTLDGSATADDKVQIVDGSLFECGTSNASYVADYPVTVGASGTATITGTKIAESFLGKGLTVCYLRNGGTYATVPRGELDDKSLTIMPQVPLSWMTSPTQPQVAQTLNITFLGHTDYPRFLQTTDRAFLVSLAGSASGEVSGESGDDVISNTPCTENPAISSGDLMLVNTISTLWRLTASQPIEGSYAVCYTATSNGAAVRIPPAQLIISERQSPFAVYRHESQTVNAFSGERFYLMFNTTVALNPVLWTASDTTSRDAVLLSSTVNCQTPLATDAVATIPDDFQYAPLIVTNPSGITTPYLHIVVRTVENCYVCMRRTQRVEGETFFDYDVIGGVDAPATIRIDAAPISTYTTTPSSPRAWVPFITVNPTFSASVTVESFAQIFFVPYTASGSGNTGTDVIDNCYRPTKEEAVTGTSTSVTLLDTTLQVTLSTLRTAFPFPQAGGYRLCLQQKGSGEHVASIPLVTQVANPSPTAYTVPEIISVNGVFSMSFIAIDAIFASTITGNKAQIYVSPGDASAVAMPSCATSEAPAGGTVSFTSFTATNTTFATVQPTIIAKGYYFVCFTVYDQVTPFPVPNLEGGFIFSVGLTGAQRYVVSPSPAYMGQKLNITILGSLLSSNDHVKIVDVTGGSSADYETTCTANAVNADAEETSGATGSVVNAVSSSQALYHPRMNSTGTFILCYQSARVGNTWAYVSDLASFTVGSPRPAQYILQPVPAYATEIDTIYILDPNANGGLLSDTDNIMLVTRGTGKAGFDCTDDAVSSSSIGALTRVDSESNSTFATYRVCGTTAVSVTVCYHLANGAWAEVPFHVPPPTYIFSPMEFLASPFSGPTSTPVSPRPYEPFTLSFESSSGNVAVSFLSFAPSPQSTCTLEPPYVTPVYYSKDNTAANTFTVALSGTGAYQLYLAVHGDAQNPRIAHNTAFTVAACDPCSFSPAYTFLDNNVTVTFPSSLGDLSRQDTVRLVPVAQGVSGRPCDAPTGAFASVTLQPIGGDASSTLFSINVGEAADFLGDYYICYRRNSVASSNYAIVVDAGGTLLTFSIYPVLPTGATLCPTSPSYLETVQFKFALNLTTYPKLGFSANDAFSLVPSSATCSESNVQATGAIHPTAHSIEAAAATWLSTLPNGHTETSYLLCFRLAGDAIFRTIEPSPLAVLPQDPSRVATVPSTITPQNETFTVQIFGSALTEADNVYVVEASQRCDERCDVPLTPTAYPGAVYNKIFVNGTFLQLDFTQAIGVNVALAICYRRTNHLLTRLAVIFIGETNPKSYAVNFIPRVGTRPTLTFTGTNLAAGDSAMIVEEGTYCDQSLAAARGVFVSATEDGTTTNFYVPLVGVSVGMYSVCYLRSGGNYYVQLSTPLEVYPGGPATYATSNTPMQARPTVVQFNDANYVSRAGDETFVACPDCSCFDGPTTAQAVLPYGTPYATAAADEDALTMRVGMEDTSLYRVCYRVTDSGFAQVGSQGIRPVANAPASVVITPDPTFQGQRLALTASTFGSYTGPNAADAAMLVTATRLCWDTESINANGILASVVNIAAVNDDGTSTWRGHVPSLGPGTPNTDIFPVDYLFCYRQSGQAEYVVVPFPVSGSSMSAANPATFVTSPTNIATGIIDAQMTFPNPVDGDTAYIVTYNGDLPNDACDNAASTIVSVAGTAYPGYNFSLPPQISLTSAVVCYTRLGATVAEVPQLLQLVEPNPSGYTTNIVADVDNGRLRQYIIFTIVGTGLNVATDAVAFTDVACASANRPITSTSSFLRRVSAFTVTSGAAEGTSVTIVAQFVTDAATPVTVHVCYRIGESQWLEIGSPFQLQTPAPSTLTLRPSLGTARAGQHVQLVLNGNDGHAVAAAAVISADNTGAGTWCHNFTNNNVREPLLRVVDASLLDVPIWQGVGAARVCVENTNAPWSDLAPTAVGAANGVVVLNPNPSSMQSYPLPPRVGQRVTLTLNLIVTSHADDKVRITLPDGTACDSASPVNGFADSLSVTVVNNVTTQVVLTDETDTFKYRSFNRTGDFLVCYYSAVESVWGVVGGTLGSGTLTVSPMAPESWAIASGEPIFAQPFAIRFTDTAGNLDAANDLAWAAPVTDSCGVDPFSCPKCILFTFDGTASSSTETITQTNVSVIVGKFNICYRLGDATAAMLPNNLEVMTGEVECVQTAAVRVGAEQLVTFRTRVDVDTSTDSWRVSFFGTPAASCADGYVDDFVAGRARLVGNTDTTVTFGVEWPVSMVSTRYLLCYTHSGVAQPLCTCDQIDKQTGECYIQTLTASPQYFSPSPLPTYVGQTIQIRLLLESSMAAYPVTAVKLVSYVDALSACRDNVIIDTTGSTLVEVSSTEFLFTFKHNYILGPSNLMVCALSPLISENYARVGTLTPTTSTNTLIIRPYLTLHTIPSAAELIRAMQTLRLNFTHVSTQTDDIVSLSDQITIVADPNNCVESSIQGTVPSDILALLMLDDTSFSNVPAMVNEASNSTRSAFVIVTFDPTNGLGTHYLCYKLAGGTWAPVLPAIDVLASAVTQCVTIPAVSPSNGNEVSLRAMQYVRTMIVGTADTSGLRDPNDGVRVVPQSSMCMDDSAVVFTTNVAIGDLTPNASVIAFAPEAGNFKVCYRIGGASSTTTNWSPVCPGLTFAAASPTGSFTGCLSLGQNLVVTASHRTGFVFTNSDRVRFIAGGDQCLYAGNAPVTVSSTITVGDAAQTTSGIALTSTSATATIPAALLGDGTSSFRPCYTDAAGNQFAVPILPSQPTVSQYSVALRNPASVQMQSRAAAGQRVLISFLAATNAVAFVPYAAETPDPFVPGALYDGKFDAGTAQYINAAMAYRDGRCYVANQPTYGVYGNSTRTLGFFDPTEGGSHIACYRPLGCSVEDVGSTFRVSGYNPESVAVTPNPPRRGQLLTFTFQRNTQDTDAVELTPGADRAAAQTNLGSCWNLADDAGALVEGTTSTTTLQNNFHAAQAPNAVRNTTIRSCYRLDGGSWSELPRGVMTLLPANPSSFTLLTGTARVAQLNLIQFQGTSLGVNDVVKIIAQSTSCTGASVPPTTIVSHNPATGESIAGSANGWSVTSTSSTTSTINISSTAEGTFSVCYRLASDTVWTLVYGDLTIYPRNPSSLTLTPTSILEGELFTLDFVAATEPSVTDSGLSANDRAVLYYGAVSCLSPGGADVILESPSRTDFLPVNVSFQMAPSSRGNHTLCYWKSIEGTSSYIIVWGFPLVPVLDNPLSYITVPEATSLRVNQLMSVVFNGFGLISGVDKTDAVKFIASTNEQTDTACRSIEQESAAVYNYPLKANGTLSLQVARFKVASTSYWVCYKLNGGQFHVMKGSALALTAADPSGATAMNSKKSPIWDHEIINWTITTSSEIPSNAYVFYSTELCNDYPYYDIPTEPSLNYFPNGAALVQGSTTAPFALLRAGSATTTTLSLCYTALDGVITMLGENILVVEAGVPPVLETAIKVTALQLFTFTLNVSSTEDDYVALVANPESCVGLTAPSNSADIFVSLQVGGEDNSVVTVTTAVSEAGTFYICYSHRVDHCAASTGQECARIVGTVVASKPNPSGWSMSPATVYTTERMEATMLNPPSVGGVAWLAPIASTGATMQDVALACMQSSTSTGRIALEHSTSNEKDIWAVRLNATASYGLCYNVTGATLPTIFPPITAAGPVVHLSQVNSVTFASATVVGVTSVVALKGRGLSQNDQLIAVGVPATSNSLPSDMCTSSAYTPRVPADPSSAGFGLNSMPLSLHFTVATRYVLCYKASASSGDMLLITSKPFTVTQAELSVAVVSAPFVGIPLYLEFRGSGLELSDQGAIIYAPSIEVNDSSICVSGEYTVMASVSDDGSSSMYITVPKQSGLHAICYKKEGSTTPMLLSTTVNVGVRTAVGAVFQQQPVCSTSAVCQTQPIVALVDVNGQVTSDPMATVRMHLSLTNGTFVDSLLTGGDVYTQSQNHAFNFLSLTVTAAGHYIMVATFDLVDGSSFTAKSSEFDVTNNDSPLAQLTCNPVGIIERSILSNGESDASAVISCVILATASTAPTQYTVTLNAGTSTEPVAAGNGANGHPQYTFTVSPPYNDWTTHYISIQVKPTQQTTWSVKYSPVIVRIGSFPGQDSILWCTSNSRNLPSPTMVRSSDSLTCHAQGRRVVNGVLVNVIAMPKYMQLYQQSNDDASTNTAINIGDYSENLEGDYIFTVTPPSNTRSLAVFGTVSESEDSNAFVPMTGSPSHFTVIGTPSADVSSLLCTSSTSGSTRWFTPLESFTCTLHLTDTAGPVNGVPSDFQLEIGPGGSLQSLANTTWGSSLIVKGTTPSQITTQEMEKGTVFAAILLADAQEVATRVTNQTFSLTANYIPLGTLIASSNGTLVYASSISTTREDTEAVISLTGSGLSLNHKYGIRSNMDCASGIEMQAGIESGSVENSLLIRVTIPNAPYFLCFAPSDEPSRWAPLSSQAINVVIPENKAGLDKWTVLLIIGVIFLFILLVLLIVLLWRVFAFRDHKTELETDDTVYMPPRTNDRFVRSSAPQQQQQQQQQHPLSDSPSTGYGHRHENNNRIRVNINDRHLQLAEVDVELDHSGDTSGDDDKNDNRRGADSKRSRHQTTRSRNQGRSPRRAAKKSGRTRGEDSRGDGDGGRRVRRHERSYIYSDSETDTRSESSDDERQGQLPRVPPPLPPSDQPPAPIGGVERETYASSAPKSGPYQHLHHPLRVNQDAMGQPPLLPRSDPNTVIDVPGRGGGNDNGNNNNDNVSPPLVSGSEGGEQGVQWVGPFMVKGHTSKPLVSASHSSSSSNVKKEGGASS